MMIAYIDDTCFHDNDIFYIYFSLFLRHDHNPGHCQTTTAISALPSHSSSGHISHLSRSISTAAAQAQREETPPAWTLVHPLYRQRPCFCDKSPQESGQAEGEIWRYFHHVLWESADYNSGESRDGERGLCEKWRCFL